jgi:hypothetical protein
VSIYLIVSIFSVVQSIFGVGLLLFGTPTLLLIGYSYSETLWILLPCSVVISLIQTVNNYNLINVKSRVAYFSIPAMVLSLTFVVLYDSMIDVGRIVGVFLLLIGVVKFSPKLQEYLRIFLEKQSQLYYVFIGLVHGISNMGGGPLSILISTIYTDQIKIRANIAFAYLILALFQLIVLLAINTDGLKYTSITLMLTSLSIYLITIKYFSDKVDNEKYISLINVIIIIYGVLSLIK